MKAIRAVQAIIAFAGFIAMLPAVTYFSTEATSGLPVETQLLAGLSVGLIALLFLASHVQPGGGV